MNKNLKRNWLARRIKTTVGMLALAKTSEDFGIVWDHPHGFWVRKAMHGERQFIPWHKAHEMVRRHAETLQDRPEERKRPQGAGLVSRGRLKARGARA